VQLASKPTEETAPAPSGPTTTLHIHLPRSDDFDADVLRMQEIEHLLSAYEGGDQVTLYIPNGIGVVRLRPHRTVTCNPALLAGLKELVGEDAVEVA
jgi:DNA polymerase III subunit alpha